MAKQRTINDNDNAIVIGIGTIIALLIWLGMSMGG